MTTKPTRKKTGEDKQDHHPLYASLSETLFQPGGKMKQLLDILPTAVWIAQDPECQFVYGNHFANELLNVSPRDNLSQSIAEPAVRVRHFMDGRELQPHELPLQKAIHTGTPQTNIEMQVEHPNLETRTLLGDSTPIFDANGKPCGAIAVFCDTTDATQKKINLNKIDLFNTAEEVAQVGSWSWDLKTQKVTWSNQMFRLFGVEKEGFDGDVNRIIAERVHPDDLPNVMEANRKVLEEETPLPLSYRILLPDGTERIVWAQGKLIRDTNGQLTALIGYVQDITERKRAEQALRKSERTLQLFVEHAPASIAMFDREMKYIAASHRFLLDYGLGEQDVVGRSHYEIFPEMPERWKEIHRRCLQGAIEKAEEDPFLRADGHLDWVHWEIYPWFDDNGEIGGIILFSEVITAKKEAEIGLNRYASQLEEAEKFAKLGSWEIDITTGKGWWSKQMYRMFGFEISETAPDFDSYLERIHPEDRHLVQDVLIKMSQGEEPLPQEYRSNPAFGPMRYFSPTVYTQKDKTGHPIRFIGTLLDITERKHVENALRSSEDRMRLTLQTTSDGFWIVDSYGNFKEINKAYCDLSGYSHEELLQMRITDVEAVESQKDTIERIQRIQKEGSDRFETRHRRKDGSEFDVEVSVNLLRESGLMVCFCRDITERKRAEREIQQRNVDLTLIMSLNEAANRGEDMETIIKSFLHSLCELLGGEDADIFLLSPDKKYLEMSYTTTSRSLIEEIETLLGTSIPKIRIPLSKSPFLKSLLANQQGTILNDPQDIQQYVTAYAETIFLPNFLRPTIKTLVPKIFGLLKVRSNISVPMISNGEAIGLLDIANRDYFTEEDLARVRNITNQITSTILRKRAETNVRKQLRRITALNEIDRAISASLDMRLSLDVLLGEVITQLEVDAAAVLLLNPVDQHLEFAAGRGFRSSNISKTRMQLGQGFAGIAGFERKVVHVDNLPEAGKLFVRAELLKDENFIEYFGVPLIAKGVLKGVLEIFNRTPLATDADWLHYLETLGGQAAIAVDNAQLFEAIQQTNQELTSAYDATIAGWSHAMDLRDKETEGHTQRVTEMTVQLAERMGISKQEQVQIRRGALLHDIGKLGVPDHILLKPGKLTDEEWHIMRQHPTYAYEMLLPIHYLRPALDIPYCHHEKWDGSGYPRQLKGNEIPLPARLFAIVDVWDALRSDRPYREGWSTEKTRDYILAESGKHFDPQVVEAFLKLLEDQPDQR